MYAVLNSENTVIDLELRDLSLSKLIHPNFQHLYVDIGENEQGVDKKWIYSPQSKKFSKPIKEYFFFNDSNICVEIKAMSESYVEKYLATKKYSFFKEYKNGDYDYGIGCKYENEKWSKEGE